MLKVNEWNEVLTYARKLADENNIGCRPYTMYDGRKGICFFQLDCDGNQYGQEVATGICNTKDEYMQRISYFVKQVSDK